jgi:hypothetical protein
VPVSHVEDAFGAEKVRSLVLQQLSQPAIHQLGVESAFLLQGHGCDTRVVLVPLAVAWPMVVVLMLAICVAAVVLVVMPMWLNFIPHLVLCLHTIELASAQPSQAWKSSSGNSVFVLQQKLNSAMVLIGWPHIHARCKKLTRLIGQSSAEWHAWRKEELASKIRSKSKALKLRMEPISGGATFSLHSKSCACELIPCRADEDTQCSLNFQN